jgi:tetratricopeptide (TPR) repeat protein
MTSPTSMLETTIGSAVARAGRDAGRAAIRALCGAGTGLAFAAALLVGCGSNESAVDERPPGEQAAEAGWTEFAAGSYARAGESFEDALAIDPLYADAWNGLGWVNVHFGLFGVAGGHFQRAIDLGLENQEALAGHAIVSELRADYDEALAASAAVLAAEPRFAFSRQRGIDYRDLRLVRARSFLTRGRVLDAKTEVDIIDPANNVNPGSETFVGDLLLLIEELGEDLYDF